MSQITQFFDRNALVMTLTGDLGTPAGPDGAGNIDIIGGTNLNTSSDAVGNQVTVNLDGTITLTRVNALTFDTNVAAAAVTLTGTTLAADGTDANIDINITPKGAAGQLVTTRIDASIYVATDQFFTSTAATGLTISDNYIEADGTDANINIDITPKGTGVIAGTELTLTTALGVPYGGTGATTLTDHGILLGSGVGSITPLGVATDGQIPIGSTGIDPVLATLTGGDHIDITNGAGSITIEGSHVVDAFTGFIEWDGAGPFFDDTTIGEFEILQSGSGYIQGIEVAWAAPQTTVGMTAGNTYWIYIDDTGTIGKSATYDEDDFRDYIVLFECLRDSTAGTNLQVTVKENHPYQVPWNTSTYLHCSIGTVFSSISDGANIILDGTQKIAISGASELEDHGLETDIPDSGGTGVTWHQYFTLGSGKWAQNSSTDTFVGEYNNAGTATALGGNKFGVYKLYASKDNLNAATPTYFAVLHTAQFNNLASAQTAVADGTIASISNELSSLEMARLGYIIFAESSTTIVDVIIDKETIGSGGTIGGTNIASLVLTDVTNFNGILSAADTTVQAALETIDDWGAGTTDHALLLGEGVGTPIGAIAVGATGEMLIGNTGADPSWSVTGALTTLNVTTVNATTVNGTTFDTNVAAAGVTLSGTSLLADGTDANIDINITAKGTGHVIIDDLTLTSELIVSSGGTGQSTLLDHGVLVGQGISDVVSLAVGTNGQVLVGSAGADPVFATITDGTGITTTLGAGTLEIESTGTTINTQTGTTYTLVIGDRGKYITFDNAAAIACTIPTNAAVALPVGTCIAFAQLGAGQLTFSGAGTTLQSADAALTTVKQHSVGYMTKILTDTWQFGGDLEA